MKGIILFFTNIRLQSIKSSKFTSLICKKTLINSILMNKNIKIIPLLLIFLYVGIINFLDFAFWIEMSLIIVIIGISLMIVIKTGALKNKNKLMVLSISSIFSIIILVYFFFNS
jgi:hypothetical protein